MNEILYVTRFFAQAAEKFGWQIAGYALAYKIAAAFGIISLASSMVLSATLTTAMLVHFDVRPNLGLMRLSLLFRMLSFFVLCFSAVHSSLPLLLLGGSLSGLFVGLFWPSFYRAHDQHENEIEDWNLFERICSVALVVFSAFLIDRFDVAPILLLSSLMATLSLLISLKLNGFAEHNHLARIVPDQLQIQPLAQLAFIEGSLNTGTTTVRALITLTDTIKIPGLPEIFSLALLIALSTALGAYTTKKLKDRGVGNSVRVRFGLIICFVSGILLFGKSTWLLGMLLIGIGSSILFPLTKNTVDNGLRSMGVGGRGMREYYRNCGRLAVVAVVGVIWLVTESVLATSILLTSIILVFAHSWRVTPLRG